MSKDVILRWQTRSLGDLWTDFLFFAKRKQNSNCSFTEVTNSQKVVEGDGWTSTSVESVPIIQKESTWDWKVLQPRAGHSESRCQLPLATKYLIGSGRKQFWKWSTAVLLLLLMLSLVSFFFFWSSFQCWSVGREKDLLGKKFRAPPPPALVSSQVWEAISRSHSRTQQAVWSLVLGWGKSTERTGSAKQSRYCRFKSVQGRAK